MNDLNVDFVFRIQLQAVLVFRFRISRVRLYFECSGSAIVNGEIMSLQFTANLYNKGHVFARQNNVFARQGNVFARPDLPYMEYVLYMPIGLSADNNACSRADVIGSRGTIPPITRERKYLMVTEPITPTTFGE